MRVPHFRQELDYSCLAACVRMILAFYGKDYSESDLRKLLKTRMGGTSPARLMWQLPTLGFEALVETGSLRSLSEHVDSGQPCIVHVWTPPLPHWDKEAIHALVVIGMSEDSVLIHDPSLPTGPTTVPLSSFVNAWAATDYLMIAIQPS
jgi:ABC-type bacteriocin/lantibiotic exporter with double-glycine peptidase domain